MQACKFCQNGGNCIQPFICVPSKKEDLIFETMSKLEHLQQNGLLLTSDRRTSDVNCLDLISNSSRALSTITDREEDEEEVDVDKEDGSDEDIELLLKKTRILPHSQSAHADLAIPTPSNKRSFDPSDTLDETNESDDSDDEFYVHKILLPFKKSKSTAGFPKETNQNLKTETIKMGTFKASKIMDVIEKQTKEMLKASEKLEEKLSSMVNFAPAMDLSWPAPESRRESKCETNIDNLLELKEFRRRESSGSSQSRVSACWSAPGQIQIDMDTEEEEDPVCTVPNSWSAPDRIRTLSDDEEDIVYNTRKNISYSSEQICYSNREFFAPNNIKDHLSADDLYFLAAGEERPEDPFIKFNIEDVDEEMDNIRRISDVEEELDELINSTEAISSVSKSEKSYEKLPRNFHSASSSEVLLSIEEPQENAQSSSTIDLGPSRELDGSFLSTSKSDSYLRYMCARPKTPCFGESNPLNRENDNLIEVVHSTASSPIEEFGPNSFIRQSKSLTFPGEIYARAVSSDDEGLANHYHRCDSPSCQNVITKEIYEKKFGSFIQNEIGWDENSDDDIVLGDLKIAGDIEKANKEKSLSLSNSVEVQKFSKINKIFSKNPNELNDEDNLSMINNPRTSFCIEHDEKNNNQNQDRASVTTFTVDDDDIPMADDPAVESPISDFIVKKYMDALLTRKSPPIASEDDLSDFDATEVETGDDVEVGERLHMRLEHGIDAMHDSSDTDLDSPIEEISDRINIYSFSGVSFRCGKSQSDYSMLNRKSALCDETVGNYNYWIQQGKKWGYRTQANNEIYAIPKSATVSYELRNFDSFKNRIPVDGAEKAETSHTLNKTNMELIRPRILSSPGTALAKAFFVGKKEEESEPVYANLGNMAPSSEEDVPACIKMEDVNSSYLQSELKIRKSATTAGFQGNSIMARPRRQLPKRPDISLTPEEDPKYINLPCSSSYCDRASDRFAEYKSPYVQHYYKQQNLMARSMCDMQNGLPRNFSSASLHGSVDRYCRDDYGIVPATTPINNRPICPPANHPARPTNLLLPHNPSLHNLFHQQQHAPNRQQIISKNSPLVHQEAERTGGIANAAAATTTTTTLADELAYADGNPPMHGGHKPNAYTLNGDSQNSVGETLLSSNHPNYHSKEATPVSGSGQSRRRPLKDILAEVLNDSRRSRYSNNGKDIDRDDETMKKSGYNNQSYKNTIDHEPYHDRGAYCDYETPVSPMNVFLSPLGRSQGRRLPPLPISSNSAAILSQFGLPANFAMQSPQRAYYNTLGSGIPSRTHPPANQPQPKEDHQICYGIDQSIIKSSNYALEDSYYEDGLNGNQGFEKRSTSLYNQEDSSGISSCCTNSEHLNPTHRVQFSFIPRHDDEILLEMGDAVHVDRECEDHWGYAAHVCEIDFVDEIVSGVLPQPNKPFKQERDTFYLTLLASVEVAHHKGNDVLIQAINKVCTMYQNKEEILCPQTILMEISFRGIHVIDKKRKDIFRCPTFDFFYSLQNISFCGAHPKQLRYFGFITKHPLLPRFACHVFLSNESTQPIVESIGRAFKRSYDEYMAFAHPTEDIFIE